MLGILGPTAVGKSAIAHEVARALGGEIIVADPFQRYRGLEVAADSPGPGEFNEVPYHFVGDLDLSEGSTAGEFGARAHGVIDDVIARGRTPIVTGGTGLYVRAAVAELGFPAAVDAAKRAEAEQMVTMDLEGAVERLRELDPRAADRIDARNPRRVARALELALGGVTDRPLDRLWDGSTRRPTRLYALARSTATLDERIEVRVEREIHDGLVAELRAVLARPDRHRAVDQIIGIREVIALDAGDLAPDDLGPALAARTRKLARRQRTWLRRQPGLRLIDLEGCHSDEAVDQITSQWGDHPL